MKHNLSIVGVVFLILLSNFYTDLRKVKRREKPKVYPNADVDFFSKIIGIADAAYDVTKIPSIWELVGTVKNAKYNGQAIIVTHKKRKLIVVGIRGTEITSLKNIATDINALKSDYPKCENCEVHSGFWKQHQAMMKDIDSILLKARREKVDSEIVVTGHSLGGALATLYSAHIMEMSGGKYKDILRVVTYGSPRVGNQAFVDYYNSLIGLKNIFRVVYRYDPVTFVPLLTMGYRHVGSYKYAFDSYESFTKVATPTDEDSMGVTSIFRLNDHRQYKSITPKFYLRHLRRLRRRRRYVY